MGAANSFSEASWKSVYSLMDIFQKLLQLPYGFNKAIEHYRAR
jgi:hypothetical protein